MVRTTWLLAVCLLGTALGAYIKEADRDLLIELTDEEIGSAPMRKFLARALDQAIKEEIFCSQGRLGMTKPRYMARLNMGNDGVSYEWITQIVSSLGGLNGDDLAEDDHHLDCYGTGYYKFVVIDVGVDKPVLVRVEPLYM